MGGGNCLTVERRLAGCTTAALTPSLPLCTVHISPSSVNALLRGVESQVLKLNGVRLGGRRNVVAAGAQLSGGRCGAVARHR
jgi:hypothetical protein